MKYKSGMKAFYQNMNTFILMILIIIIFNFNEIVNAHSNLADPLPTRELHCRVGAQHGRDCPGPCPIPDDYGRLNHPVSPKFPAATWRRGQTVKIRWHRDNHDGTGFVRLSLLPIGAMMNKKAHEKLAFHYTCMGTGLHNCNNRTFDVCGNDMEGKAWQSDVTVPTIYGDGVYVLGWSWYGGGDYRHESFFGDYYSCSFVRISGGLPVTRFFKSTFDGNGRGGRCVSSVNRLGICSKERCQVGRTYWMIPFEFNNGNIPFLSYDDIKLFSGSTDNRNQVSLGGRSNLNKRRMENQEEKEDKAVDSRIGQNGLSVKFLDLKTFKKIVIEDGGMYTLKDFSKGLTVEAFYNKESDVKHIEFLIDGIVVRRERQGPFVMNGNNGNVIYAWNHIPIDHMMKLQVYVMKKNGRGKSDMFEADIQFS